MACEKRFFLKMLLCLVPLIEYHETSSLQDASVSSKQHDPSDKKKQLDEERLPEYIKQRLIIGIYVLWQGCSHGSNLLSTFVRHDILCFSRWLEDHILVYQVLDLMLQSHTFISTVPCLLVEMVIQARVPILWKRIQVWSWIHWLEMTSLAQVIKDLGYGSTQWIEVPSKFRCLSRLATILSLILLLIFAWALVLIWMNNIDVR
jgi:hypothetical protein